ncbi:MAG: ketoacyl-ACP synthase III [Limnochordaceae bacterium]|nr:ketoacyl-ACP synthase III [Limnochordaceae bacterium]
MNERSVTVLGVGAAVPDRVVTNDDLAAFLDTSDDWIARRTGIRQRRVAGLEMATSDLAVRAAWEALQGAGAGAGNLDLILVATSTPDHWMPSTAALVQHALGATRAGALDVNAACAGFTYAVATGAQFVLAGTYRSVLVIGADLMSRVVDWSDRSTAVLFGDGAGAVLLGASRRPALFHSILGADGSGAHLLEIPAGGSRLPPSSETVRDRLHSIRMQGREVFQFGVNILVRSLRQATEEAGLQIEDLALIIPHQANIRIIQSAAERLGVPLDRFWANLDRFGNTSAASIPLALAEAVSSGRVHQGDVLAFVGFGAGLTWGVNLVTWGGE